MIAFKRITEASLSMGKSNVNPDHYKVAGRERQGEDVVQHLQKQKYNREQARLRQRQRAQNASEALPGSMGRKKSRRKSSKPKSEP